MTGFVYAIGNPDGAVKIGFARNPQQRLASLRCGSQEDLRILGVLPGDRSVEAYLHQRFSAERIRGEWFKREGAVAQFVADLQPYPDRTRASRTRKTHRRHSPSATGRVGSFTDLIDKLGGYLRLSEALGLPRGTVSAMRTRNSIPPEQWPAVVREAQRQGLVDITVESLAELRAPRQKRTKLDVDAA